MSYNVVCYIRIVEQWQAYCQANRTCYMTRPKQFGMTDPKGDTNGGLTLGIGKQGSRLRRQKTWMHQKPPKVLQN